MILIIIKQMWFWKRKNKPKKEYKVCPCNSSKLEEDTKILKIYSNVGYYLQRDIKKLTQLEVVKFIGNHFDVKDLEYLPDSIKVLDIRNTKIDKLPERFNNLKYLNISRTKIKEIPLTYTNLEELYCIDTYISSIPETFTKLRKLNIYNTDIKTIPDSIINLEYLDCQKTEIESLPKTLKKLNYINCMNSKLLTIPDEILIGDNPKIHTRPYHELYRKDLKIICGQILYNKLYLNCCA